MTRWQAATRAAALTSLALVAQAAGAPPPISRTETGDRSAHVVAEAPARPGASASGARELVLFEAASLKDAFARLGAAFTQQNAGVKVLTNVAGSQELRAQIEQGAAADVFASADRKHMNALAAAGLVTNPKVFACNELVVVVRPALAATVTTLADLATVERIVVGAPEVPVGSYTQQFLNRAATKLGADFARRVEARIVSREPSVRQVLAKVLLGEADAAVVYRSDAATARGQVSIVAIPTELNIVAEYPIAILTAAPHAELGRRWIELVRSPAGGAALRDAGFMACPKLAPDTSTLPATAMPPTTKPPTTKPPTTKPPTTKPPTTKPTTPH